MSLELRQSTAVDILIGPFLDSTDGNTVEDGLTVTQAEVRLSKKGGNMAQKNEATSLVHDELGQYVCKLDADDTDTLGILKLIVHESGALQVWECYSVINQNSWDSKYSTDKLQVDAVEISGDSTAADDLELFIEALGTDDKPLISTDAQDLSATLDVNAKTLESGLDLTDTMKSSVNAEVDTALNTAIPGSPAANSINQRVAAIDDLTQAEGDGDLAAIKVKTDTIPASPAAVGSLMGLLNDAITSAKFDESTAFPVKLADTGVTQIARVGADGDTLETLSDQIDTAQTDLNNPDQYKADVSGLATSANLQTVDNNVDEIQGKLPTNKIMGSSDVADHDGDLAGSYMVSAQARLNTDPDVTGSLQDKINFDYERNVNKKRTTANSKIHYKSDGTTPMTSQTITSDDTECIEEAVS